MQADFSFRENVTLKSNSSIASLILNELAKTLSEHGDMDAIWNGETSEGSIAVHNASAANMNRTWVVNASAALPNVDDVLRETTQVKNIWVLPGA